MAGHQTTLTFSSFDVEQHPQCGWDYVEVSYGDFRQKFCGDSVPGPFTSSHTITVKMHTDRSVTRPGFAAEWGTIPDSPVPSCECGMPHRAISTSRIVGGQD